MQCGNDRFCHSAFVGNKNVIMRNQPFLEGVEMKILQYLEPLYENENQD
jgi:hypothetical protein